MSLQRLARLRKLNEDFRHADGRTFEGEAIIEKWDKDFSNGRAIEDLFNEIDRLRSTRGRR